MRKSHCMIQSEMICDKCYSVWLNLTGLLDISTETHRSRDSARAVDASSAPHAPNNRFTISEGLIHDGLIQSLYVIPEYFSPISIILVYCYPTPHLIFLIWAFHPRVNCPPTFHASFLISIILSTLLLRYNVHIVTYRLIGELYTRAGQAGNSR